MEEVAANNYTPAVVRPTIAEAENTLAKFIVVTGELGHKVIPLILKEKEQIVKKPGGETVEYIHPRHTLDGVGGLDLLKTWAMERLES